MKSLRWRLLLSLWVSLILVGAPCALFIYLQARAQTNTLLDYQMEQIADFVASETFPASAPITISPRVDLDHEAEDDFIVTVRKANGELIYASRPNAPLPDFDWTGYRTLQIGHKSFRVFAALTSTQNRIVVAQQTETRREVAEDAAYTALLPVWLLIPVLGLVLGIVIHSQLKPIREVAEAVSRHPALSLEPLPLGKLPSEVRPLIAEINRLLSRQGAAIAREQAFISDAAHALRSPLTALQLQADILEGSALAEENEIRRAALRTGIRRAVRLMDQLLALARSQHATQAVTSQTGLDEAVAEVKALYSAIAEARNIDLIVDAHCGAQVPGDARHLLLLIGNLLDNALRYTPAGGRVNVTARIENGRARIEVRDEGKGLPAGELETVFERFRRAADDDTEGSGLGLSVVRSLATQLGGRAWLENRKDCSGLCACIELPCVDDAAAIVNKVPR